MKNLRIHTLEGNSELHIVVVGNLSSVDALEFKKESQRIISATSKNVIMDLSQVTGFDIAGLNAVLQVHRNLKSKGSNLEVLTMENESLTELFSLTQFDRYLSLIPAA